jgi:CRP-like cAMP-binding protein
MTEKNPFARFLQHFEKGALLFKEGDEGEDMFIIQSGRVAIKKRVPHGETTLAVLEKGDFFGEMALLERLPRSAAAEMIEDGDLIVIGGDVFSDMIKSNPEIAVRMLRKYSLRLRETTRQIEQLAQAGGLAPPVAGDAAPPVSTTMQAEAIAYFISLPTGNVFPVFKAESLIGRYDSVTGMSPEVDLTNEDASRNISRRHARILLRDGQFYVAEEIGTMNGTFLNGERLSNGVLTPINDGDQLTLCRLSITFKVPGTH